MEQNLKKIKRTIQKQKMKDFCIVLLFFLILPYTCGILFASDKIVVTPIQKEEAANMSVLLQRNYGEQQIALNEYLVGVLASVIPGEYEKETIKAQSIIIRSACFYAVCNSEEKSIQECMEIIRNGKIRLDQQQMGVSYLTQKERKLLWKENASAYEQKFLETVGETDNLVIYYDEEMINPPYFRLSNGMTINPLNRLS